KIVVVGYTDNLTAYFDVVLIRYNQDGSLDNSFGDNGIEDVSLANANDEAMGVVLETDGKIVVVGSLFNGTNDDYFIARFNTDGSLDNSFGTGGLAQVDYNNENQEAMSVAIQVDGKILV